MGAGKLAAEMAAGMLLGCSGWWEKRTAANDPCLLMEAEARTVERLERDIRRLTAQIRAEEGNPKLDTTNKVEAESLLAYKREILADTKTSMTTSARMCMARKQPFDRYRTAPEREDNRL